MRASSAGIWLCTAELLAELPWLSATRAFDLLAEELLSDDESLCSWAERGLRLLDTKDARRLLWQWQINGGQGNGSTY